MNRLFIVVPTIDYQDDNYFECLKPSLTDEQRKKTFLITNEHCDSIFKKYNYAVDLFESLHGLQDDDIILFTHSDITILDELFEDKLRMVFDYKPEVGIIGVYGTTSFNEKFGWWLNDRKIFARGHINQGVNGQYYHMHEQIGFFDNMVVVDGCFFAVRGALAKILKFRDMDGFHQYENSYCIDTLVETDYKIAVADIYVQHESEGPLSEDWYRNSQILRIEYVDKGLKFPLTTEGIYEFKKNNK